MAGVTRWLVVGPYPPERGSGAAAAAAFVAERLGAGDLVHVVSPRPTAAHVHADLIGPAGVRALWRMAREQRAAGLWLRVEPGVVLRHGVDRRRALVERAAFALFLRRFATAVLDVGDVGLLPGGRAGRPVLAAASRLVVHRARDADALVASGADPSRIERRLHEETTSGAAGAAMPPAPLAPLDPADVPPPIALRDLPPDRAAIEAAVRARAEQLRAARRAARRAAVEAATDGAGPAG